jgi:hypothetical protein
MHTHAVTNTVVIGRRVERRSVRERPIKTIQKH